jgi:hypothetical protein
MRRTLIIALSWATACLLVVAIWMYVKQSEKGGVPSPGGAVSDDQTKKEPSGPTEQQKMATALHVFNLPVRIAFFGDDHFSPCFFEFEKNTLYRWKGVMLRREQVPNAGPLSRIPVLNAKDFTVLPVEAPVKYLEVSGRYRPGYLDRKGWIFYEWKGVLLDKQQLLDKSQDGQDAVVEPTFRSLGAPDLIEVEMPVQLREHPALWKKT